MATLFDVFDDILKQAEEEFYNFHFEQALQKYQDYFKITAKVEYQLIIKQIQQLLKEIQPQQIETLFELHRAYRYLREKYAQKQIHPYTYKLFTQLLSKHYQQKFQSLGLKENPLAHGIFLFLLGDLDNALILLKQYSESQPENIEARVFIGHVYVKQNQHKKTVALLTQNLFLAADQLFEEDLYLSQFKMLYGRLHSQTGRRDVAMWLLVFEAWYRNYLIIDQDEPFFKIMLKKEQNERIIRVKYTMAERYRHLARCLFLAEYIRQYLKSNKGMVADLEAYMEQLDIGLFLRYRKKRKPLK